MVFILFLSLYTLPSYTHDAKQSKETIEITNQKNIVVQDFELNHSSLFYGARYDSSEIDPSIAQKNILEIKAIDTTSQQQRVVIHTIETNPAFWYGGYTEFLKELKKKDSIKDES